MKQTKKYALISVSDKTGVTDFAKELTALGYSIISTGGTYDMLHKADIPVTAISDITGFPECLDGRVKTLHPKIHGGLLALRENFEHMETLERLGIEPIDIAVINLYPFKNTIAKPDATFEEAIENIDIGGPTMLRAAAKNYGGVTVICDPSDYTKVANEIKTNGSTTKETRLRLAYKVFAHTAEYDALIADYLRRKLGIELPSVLTLPFEKHQSLRYGENPHQAAAFYKESLTVQDSLVTAEQLHGKELSYNNIADTNGALEILREFDDITIVAVKHSNPCGVASGTTLLEAWEKAYNADPTSIFGGIIASNAVVDVSVAEKINNIFIEIVVAPGYTPEALEVLKKKKNIRLLCLPSCERGYRRGNAGYDYKRVDGGILVQERDSSLLGNELAVVTKRQPTEKELEDMMFAWRIVKHVKSNAIAIAKDNCSVGIGVGQVNRIWATEQAIEHGGEKVPGSALASDAFFPFDDGVRTAARAGITAVIQPGGSIGDQKVIEACDELGLTMVFTGQRHFKHS